jgi:hypothetical protein
MRTAKRE